MDMSDEENWERPDPSWFMDAESSPATDSASFLKSDEPKSTEQDKDGKEDESLIKNKDDPTQYSKFTPHGSYAFKEMLFLFPTTLADLIVQYFVNTESEALVRILTEPKTATAADICECAFSPQTQLEMWYCDGDLLLRPIGDFLATRYPKVNMAERMDKIMLDFFNIYVNLSISPASSAKFNRDFQQLIASVNESGKWMLPRPNANNLSQTLSHKTMTMSWQPDPMYRQYMHIAFKYQNDGIHCRNGTFVRPTTPTVKTSQPILPVFQCLSFDLPTPNLDVTDTQEKMRRIFPNNTEFHDFLLWLYNNISSGRDQFTVIRGAPQPVYDFIAMLKRFMGSYANTRDLSRAFYGTNQTITNQMVKVCFLDSSLYSPPLFLGTRSRSRHCHSFVIPFPFPQSEELFGEFNQSYMLFHIDSFPSTWNDTIDFPCLLLLAENEYNKREISNMSVILRIDEISNMSAILKRDPGTHVKPNTSTATFPNVGKATPLDIINAIQRSYVPNIQRAVGKLVACGSTHSKARTSAMRRLLLVTQTMDRFLQRMDK